MYYGNKIWIGLSEGEKVCIEPRMANRHGLIAGATGTGKTTTLKVLAESFSDAGVPVFLADIKGDLSGMIRPGEDSEKMQERIRSFGLAECGFSYRSYPASFWDIYGRKGIPTRTTISEMGPVLLSKLMDLNQTQSDIMTIVFKIADDEGLLLIDTKDLRAILTYVSEHSSEYSARYGNMSKQSIGAILRNVVALEAAGGETFFAEPALAISDWFQTDADGRGMINILDSTELVKDTALYSTFLLWMLSELFDILPEVGDPDKPRMVFFFDEAHLLFKNISKALREKIEQVVKLIRSKGVGIYFITQSPKDVPDEILAQLGNKIQHALHAYTPAEERAVKAAASSFRANPAFDTYTVLQELGVGEALISVLDEQGVPCVVKRSRILPPQSFMGIVPDEERERCIALDNKTLKYQDMVDRDSAYEFLQRMNQREEMAAREAALQAQKAKEEAALAAQKAKEDAAAARQAEREALAAERAAQKAAEREAAQKAKEEAAKKAKSQRAVKNTAMSAAGTVGREVGKTVGKTLGGRFGKTLGGNVGASLFRSILGTIFK